MNFRNQSKNRFSAASSRQGSERGHNYSKSSGCFRQSTRQIKNKLVPAQQCLEESSESSNSEIREEDKEYE